MVQICTSHRGRPWGSPGEPLTPDEARWQRIRSAVAELDGSWGSLADVVTMEEQGRVVGEWLPVREPRPPSYKFD